MIYRPASLTDVKALEAIELVQPRCAGWKSAGWQSELKVPVSYVLCAEMTHQVVGFIALRFTLGVGEIVNIGVAPAYTRQGIGRALLQQVLSWVRARGGGHLSLEVGVTNLPAIRLYEQTGFVQVGLRRNFYPGPEDALVMEIKV